MKKRVFAGLVLGLLLLSIPLTAFAGGVVDGRIIMGGSFTLAEGEVLEGDLVIFGGTATLEVGSIVEGDVFLMGGNANIDGTVEGDLTIMGGNINLGSTAIIDGNLTTFGGNVNRDAGATIGGEFISGEGVAFPFDFDIPSYTWARDYTFEPFQFGSYVLLDAVWFVVRSFMLAALAVLVVMFWQAPTERTAKAVVDQPILSGGLGLLTFIITPLVLLLLLITLIGPVIAVMVLVLACVFGWIAVGLEVGKRMAEAFKWELHPAATAGLGTLLVSFVAGGIGFIPCIGWMAPFLVLALGLGGVILTRFGSREYVRVETSEKAE